MQGTAQAPCTVDECPIGYKVGGGFREGIAPEFCIINFFDNLRH